MVNVEQFDDLHYFLSVFRIKLFSLGTDPDPPHCFFGQVPPKPNQKHHLDLNGLLMDGSGSRFLKSGSGFLKSGSAKKPGSIRIRNTVFIINFFTCRT